MAPKTRTYTLARGGTHTRLESDGTKRTYRGGDKIRMTDEAAHLYRHRLEGGAPGQYDEEATEIVEVGAAGGESGFDGQVLEGTVAEIAPYIDGLGDPEQLRALLKAEQAGQNRRGVVTKVEDRLAVLKEG